MAVVDERKRPSAREKVRLDSETIIEAGLQIARRPGATTVTVRELGAVLGADPTAIYRHFRSKESLMQALLDRVLAMSLEQVTAPRDDWRTRITQLMTATLDTFITYPAIGVEAIVLTTEGAAELDIIEMMLDCFAQTGLEGDELVRHYSALATYALSFAAGIARELTLSDPADDAEPRPWIGRSLQVSAASHPRITELRDGLAALRDRDIFGLGVSILLDAAERAGAEMRAASELRATSL